MSNGLHQRGFSIIELVISIAIFVVVIGVVTFNQQKFGTNILITNLAYDVALAVRQAQVYGMSVKQASAGNFTTQYGVHFFGKDKFVLFNDLNNDGKYETTADNGKRCVTPSLPALPECLQVFTFERGNFISRFCGDNGGTQDCYIAGGDPEDSAITSLDVIFHRPNPEPTVNSFLNGSSFGTYGGAVITVSTPANFSKRIIVSAAGQISIQ